MVAALSRALAAEGRRWLQLENGYEPMVEVVAGYASDREADPSHVVIRFQEMRPHPREWIVTVVEVRSK